MLDSVYHMALELFVIMFWCENANILPNMCDVVMSVISLCYQIC